LKIDIQNLSFLFGLLSLITAINPSASKLIKIAY